MIFKAPNLKQGRTVVLERCGTNGVSPLIVLVCGCTVVSLCIGREKQQQSWVEAAELGVPEAGQLEFTEQSPVEERASQREPQKSAQDHHESSV